ncbi:hypothetical protein LSH36_271g04040 [Paralvinella palmiformis]|uniref:Uncharacterized protein n=1 Tax=Paralvinella palmiformis TaxID=53620 RepID=A0AAD9N3Q5_9ANNE|nr:hypothetical protein LSH36_271g04040 [Paralvinella palmiformis]
MKPRYAVVASSKRKHNNLHPASLYSRIYTYSQAVVSDSFSASCKPVAEESIDLSIRSRFFFTLLVYASLQPKADGFQPSSVCVYFIVLYTAYRDPGGKFDPDTTRIYTYTAAYRITQFGKGFNKLKGDINTVVGNIQSDVKSNLRLHQKKSRDEDDNQPKAQTSSIVKTLAPVAIQAAASLATEYLTKGDAGSMMTSFRRYFKGWTPKFNDAIDDFFGRPTIRDTGRGSAHRSIVPRRPGLPEPKTFEEVVNECLENGCLWEDPDFPACEESMYYDSRPPCGEVEWLRPGDICGDPQMFVEGASRLDVIQGVLGDCWLLAAVSCLATNEDLLHKIIPDGQSFDTNYAGVFRFMFWQYGRWVEVLIDDRLPTSNGQLIYMHSGERNEFWSALLNGCYENLSGGLTSEALTDFTGGISERYTLRDETPDDLFKTMHKAASKGAMMGCSIDASPDQMEAQLDNGLIIGHAYSITSVRYVEVQTARVSGKIPMLRIRNPWGDSHEWKGAWSDEMSYTDFKDEFMRLEICYLGPDTLEEEAFWSNPQYVISVVDPDEDDEDGNGSIIVGLMQKERRKLRAKGESNLTIGFAIYQLDNPDCGHYVIIPSTFEPNQEGDFVLRVFSERKDDNVRELDDHTGTADPEFEELGDDTEDDAARLEEGYEAFRNAAGEDGEVDAYELKEMLNGVFLQDFEFDGFSVDMCRSMIAMCDADLSGKLNFTDYQTLWKQLNMFKKAFCKMDTDNSGYFNSYEFRKVLNTLGMF